MFRVQLQAAKKGLITLVGDNQSVSADEFAVNQLA